MRSRRAQGPQGWQVHAEKLYHTSCVLKYFNGSLGWKISGATVDGNVCVL